MYVRVVQLYICKQLTREVGPAPKQSDAILNSMSFGNVTIILLSSTFGGESLCTRSSRAGPEAVGDVTVTGN